MTLPYSTLSRLIFAPNQFPPLFRDSLAKHLSGTITTIWPQKLELVSKDLSVWRMLLCRSLLPLRLLHRRSSRSHSQGMHLRNTKCSVFTAPNESKTDKPRPLRNRSTKVSPTLLKTAYTCSPSALVRSVDQRLRWRWAKRGNSGK